MAREVGRLLAERGVQLLCGGLGGVMEEAARGAFEQDGLVVGILPGTDAADGSPWLTVRLPTGLGEGRNLVLVRSAQAVIAIGGGLGTLMEVAAASQLRLPVAVLEGWQLKAPDGRGTTELGISEFEEAQAAVDWAVARASQSRIHQTT